MALISSPNLVRLANVWKFLFLVCLTLVSQGMGIETDQEICQFVGSEEVYANGLAASLEECSGLGIHSQVPACS
jgi:hypothetical protein